MTLTGLLTDLVPSIGDAIAVADWLGHGALAWRARRADRPPPHHEPTLAELPPAFTIVGPGPFDWRNDPEL